MALQFLKKLNFRLLHNISQSEAHRYHDALIKIASCNKIVNGDVVDIARNALLSRKAFTNKG